MSIKINKEAIILNGILKGVKGNVVGADSTCKLVQIRIDERCVIETDYDNIHQDSFEERNCGNCAFRKQVAELCIDCRDSSEWVKSWY